MKHTPGPWIVDDKFPLTVRPTISSTDERYPGPCPVANVSLVDIGILRGAHGNEAVPFEEAKANARLIAAAPELLELLSIMFDAYENGVPCYEDPEEEYHYLGNAFKLKDEHFHRIADLLNKLDPREEPAKSTGGK
jgi:hypothetical protein